MSLFLKRKHVFQHFSDYFDDQYDFHSYAARKLTLRAYDQLLKWEDKLFSHPFYFRCASGLVMVLFCFLNFNNLLCF